MVAEVMIELKIYNIYIYIYIYIYITVLIPLI